MKAWIGCYGCYNDGRLVGKWLDADEAEDLEAAGLTVEAAHKLDGKSHQICPRCGSDEFAVFDTDGGPSAVADAVGESILEFVRLAPIAELAETLSGFEQWLSELGDVPEGDADEVEQAFYDAYLGEYSSAGEWAELYLEETGVLAEVPERLRYYVDFEAYARDARLSGEVSFVEGPVSVFVFREF